MLDSEFACRARRFSNLTLSSRTVRSWVVAPTIREKLDCSIRSGSMNTSCLTPRRARSFGEDRTDAAETDDSDSGVAQHGLAIAAQKELLARVILTARPCSCRHAHLSGGDSGPRRNRASVVHRSPRVFERGACALRKPEVEFHCTVGDDERSDGHAGGNVAECGVAALVRGTVDGTEGD